MTAQIEDEFHHEGRRFSIAAVTGRGIFRPQDFGLAPRRILTSCARGYLCRYAVVDGSLRLLHLFIGIDEPMTLLGGSPLPGAEGFSQVYEDLPEPVPFSGGILIGHTAIYEYGEGCPLMVHRGTRDLLPFRLLDDLRELVFEAGRLVSDAKRSDAVERLVERARVGQGMALGDELGAWLRAEFARTGYIDYERWLYGG